tara:strand:+ start:38 stop:556 length:519 start_codon:yes stop_codon:yes gene_type:complete
MSTLRVNTIQEADGSIFSRVLQIVQTSTHTRTETTSTTYVSTSHTVTITPIFASSKILVNFSGCVNTNGTNHRAAVDVYRSIAGGTDTGIAPVGSAQTIGANNNGGFFGGIRADSSRLQAPTTINFLDSPSYSLGNSIVYTLRIRSTTGNTVEIPSSNNEEPIINMATEIAS